MLVTWIDGRGNVRTGKIIVDKFCHDVRTCVIDDRNNVHLHPRNINKI